MKRFVLHVVLMSVLFVALYSIVSISTSKAYVSKSRFALSSDVTAVVLGHSHPECAVNDELLNSTVNLASSGEAYFYTYQKLKRVIKDNPQINRVFLEFTNNHVLPIMEEWTFGEEKLSYHLPKYLPFVSKDYLSTFTERAFDPLSGAFLKSSRENLFRVFSGDYDLSDEIGGFNSLSHVLDLEVLPSESEHDEYDITNVPEFNLLMLDSILNLTDKNGIEVIGLRSPQHTLIHDIENEVVYQSVRAEKFKGRKFWDFGQMNLPDNSFADLGHLNATGASTYTQAIQKRIGSELSQN